MRHIYTNKDTDSKIDWILTKEPDFNFSAFFAKEIDQIFESYNCNKETRLLMQIEEAKKAIDSASKNLAEKEEEYFEFKKKLQEESENEAKAFEAMEKERLIKKINNFRDLIESRDTGKILTDEILTQWIQDYSNSNFLIDQFLKTKGYEIRDYQLCKIGGTK